MGKVKKHKSIKAIMHKGEKIPAGLRRTLTRLGGSAGLLVAHISAALRNGHFAHICAALRVAHICAALRVAHICAALRNGHFAHICAALRNGHFAHISAALRVAHISAALRNGHFAHICAALRVAHICAALLLAHISYAGMVPRNCSMDGRRSLDDDPPSQRLLSNVIIDILATSSPDTFWLGTGTGVTRMDPSVDSPEGDAWASFQTWGEAQGVGKGGVAGLYVSDSIVFASFAFDTSVGISGAGGGIAYTRDRGANWTWFPQPRDRLYDVQDNGRDAVLGYWPTATNVDNISYDICLSDSFVWIVSKGGGLRRHAFAADYTDYNDTTGWVVISPDTNEFHPGQLLNHRTFSCVYGGGALWVGTAGGINKSTNNGQSWQNFSSGNSDVSGNFVTALGFQTATNTLWAATWRAEGQNEFYAVSKTTDGGQSWTVSLTEDQIQQAIGRVETPRVHSFAFDGTAVYACDDIGLWKSVDGGQNWGLFPRIQDATSGRQLGEDEIYGALVAHGYLWAGGLDGLARSSDNGAHWSIYQTASPLDQGSRPVDTYAYPCPWSPDRFGPVKLRYTTTGGPVTVTIYDFAMSEVVTLPTATRTSGEQYESWDGKKSGTIVANGTYFYKIERADGEIWGKLIVLD